MPKRKTLALTDEAAEVLPKLAGYHDQGNYISQLIMSAAVEANLVPAQEIQVQTSSSADVQDSYQTLFAQAQDADITALRRMVRKLIREVVAIRGELDQRGSLR